jgi:DNA-binding transcriptional LysR family regulator
MELRHLKYFVAVAEELHFRRAAERLHIAQPAVSEQVRKLEAELGVRLLNRTQRSVSLTPAGAVFLREARRVLAQANTARLAARNARDRVTSSLRVGYMPACLPASVPRTLQRLATSMPQLETTFEHGSGAELIEAVRAERLDAAIVPLPAPTGGLRITALGEQRALAALPVIHDHAVRSEICLEQVAPCCCRARPIVPSMTVSWRRATAPAYRQRSWRCRTRRSSGYCSRSRRGPGWRCFPNLWRSAMPPQASASCRWPGTRRASQRPS